jgi:predicted dehydrogenase
MKRVRIAVVGAGYLGRFHAQKLAALEHAELVGVCDIDLATATAVAAETGSTAYSDIADLLDRLDAVSIAATTSAHFDLARACLERDIHVFVEKPIAQSSAEGAQLVALAAAKGLTLQVGHIERFNPALLTAQDMLHDVRFIESHRLAAFKARGVDVDVVLDLMIHDLDVILALVRSKPVQVSAVGIPVLTNRVDIANARIEFENGAIANVTASRVSTTAQRKLRAFQPNQYLSIDFGAGTVQRVTSDGASGKVDQPFNVENWILDKGDPLMAELAAFVDAVRNATAPPVTGEDGRLALELAEQVLASMRHGHRGTNI